MQIFELSPGQSVKIGADVVVQLVGGSPYTIRAVQLGIQAPRSVPIMRAELLAKIEAGLAQRGR